MVGVSLHRIAITWHTSWSSSRVCSDLAARRPHRAMNHENGDGGGDPGCQPPRPPLAASPGEPPEDPGRPRIPAWPTTGGWTRTPARPEDPRAGPATDRKPAYRSEPGRLFGLAGRAGSRQAN